MQAGVGQHGRAIEALPGLTVEALSEERFRTTFTQPGDNYFSKHAEMLHAGSAKAQESCTFSWLRV
jgi:hypothetical protein